MEMAVWYILWTFGKIFPVFGILHQEKSGNPGLLPRHSCQSGPPCFVLFSGEPVADHFVGTIENLIIRETN
jgi:hypothetical protein